MFKHVLIPTDGSALSGVALAHGVALAERLDAKVTVLHVTLPFHAITTDSMALSDTRVVYEASHGRSGLAELWYGSETHDVLTHSRIPTLVYR